MPSRRIFILLTPLLVFSGCSALGPGVSITMMAPAGSREAAKVKEVAVLPFDGTYGREVASDIESILTSTQLGSTPYFKVADRTRTEAVMREIRLSQSGLISKDQSLRLGKLLGVKGIYTGTAGQPRIAQSHTFQTRDKCIEQAEKTKGGILGELLRKCKKSVETKVKCTKTDATFSFTPKLIRVETGQIVFSKTMEGSTSHESCEDADSPPPTSSALAGQAKAIALEQFRREVAPSSVSERIQLFDSLPQRESEASRVTYVKGLEFAKANRMDRACEIWREMDSQSDPGMVLKYSLGVCSEAEGDFDKAAKLYEAADRLTDKPEGHITAALQRIRKALSSRVLLKQQLQ